MNLKNNPHDWPKVHSIFLGLDKACDVNDSSKLVSGMMRFSFSENLAYQAEFQRV